MNEESDITTIAVHMVAAGLPDPFVLRVLALARTSEGVEDLMHLWAKAVDVTKRGDVEADLQEAIEDREPPGTRRKIESTEDAQRLLEHRLAWKTRLRALVESRGGVSDVARRAGIPQPSLSRLLNSMSEPRPATIRRLADAMELVVEDLMLAEPRSISVPSMASYVVHVPAYISRAINAVLDQVTFGHGRRRAEAP